MASISHWSEKMARDDKAFYVDLGRRIARHRKAQGMTQVQLAKVLGIAQQTLAHYEGGRLRIAVALIPELSKVLDVSVAELIDESPPPKSRRGPIPIMQRQVEQIRTMPRAKQKFISDMLDALIKQEAAG